MKSNFTLSKLSLLVAYGFALTTITSSCGNRGQSNDKAISDSTSISTLAPDSTQPAAYKTDSTKATSANTNGDTLPTAPSVAPHHKPLTLVIKNMQTPDGPIVVGVYQQQNKFLDEKDEFKKYTIKPNKDGIVTIKDLDYGEFALALYQDVNSDGKINKNGIGIPKEPYAFSNNYKPVVKAPAYKDCKFAYNSAGSDTLVISMIR